MDALPTTELTIIFLFISFVTSHSSSWLPNAGFKHPTTRVCQSGLCSADRRIYAHDSRAHTVSKLATDSGAQIHKLWCIFMCTITVGPLKYLHAPP